MHVVVTFRIPGVALTQWFVVCACAAVLTRFSYVFGLFSECEAEDAGEYCVGNQLVYRYVHMCLH